MCVKTFHFHLQIFFFFLLVINFPLIYLYYLYEKLDHFPELYAAVGRDIFKIPKKKFISDNLI